MKSFVEEPPEQAFESFKLVIEVETANELIGLYHHFNLSADELERLINDGSKKIQALTCSVSDEQVQNTDLFNLISEMADARGLLQQDGWAL